jgi:5-methylcytosine-specific restriction endonuclease McrA
VFQKDDINHIILSSIQTRTCIEKDSTNTDSHFKELQCKLEKILNKLKPLQSLKSSMYLSFLLGYIYLWRKAIPSVRSIAETEEFLHEFAKESLKTPSHNHCTLNNGPQTKAFIASFPLFRHCFYSKIAEHTPIPSSPLPKKKESIPSTVKTDVWDTYIGKEKGEGECFCCGNKCISQRDFHAGHIVPEVHGGAADVANLRPICPSCNSSMGTQNMLVFMKKHYPDRAKEMFSTN